MNHAPVYHRHVATSMSENETDVPESGEGAGEQEVCDCARGVLRNLCHERSDVREQSAATLWRRRMHEHDGLASLELLEGRPIGGIAEPVVAVTAQQADFRSP